MKYIFILNSFGNNDSAKMFNRIKEVCKYLGLNYEIEINSDYYSTSDILKKYQDTENIIMAVGGDGMINRVLNGIVGTNNVLGYIPFGTGNDFHKTVVETIEEEITPVDIVKINDKYFINIACFGIDSDIANDDYFIHNKYIPKSQRYNMSVLYHFIKYKARKLEIMIDQEIIRDEYTTLVVANGKYYGGGYRVGTNSTINDGLLDVYLIKNMPKLKMAKAILGMKDGKHEKLDEVKKISITNLIINSDSPFKSNVDGEILEDNCFDIHLIHEGIKLYNNPTLVKRLINKG